MLSLSDLSNGHSTKKELFFSCFSRLDQSGMIKLATQSPAIWGSSMSWIGTNLLGTRSPDNRWKCVGQWVWSRHVGFFCLWEETPWNCWIWGLVSQDDRLPRSSPCPLDPKNWHFFDLKPSTFGGCLIHSELPNIHWLGGRLDAWLLDYLIDWLFPQQFCHVLGGHFLSKSWGPPSSNIPKWRVTRSGVPRCTFAISLGSCLGHLVVPRWTKLECPHQKLVSVEVRLLSYLIPKISVWSKFCDGRDLEGTRDPTAALRKWWWIRMLAGVPMTLPNYAAEESNLFGDDLPNDMPLSLTVDRFILRFHLWEVSPVRCDCFCCPFAQVLGFRWMFINKT